MINYFMVFIKWIENTFYFYFVNQIGLKLVFSITWSQRLHKHLSLLQNVEAVVQKLSIKKVFLKILQNP